MASILSSYHSSPSCSQDTSQGTVSATASRLWPLRSTSRSLSVGWSGCYPTAICTHEPDHPLLRVLEACPQKKPDSHPHGLPIGTSLRPWTCPADRQFGR